ncbi:mechanosensitive ion channel family protein [Candidatus Methylocalor cossyra]|uniref:Small-conductance mechanosensitive channel n=1 Tax=Candidatus Methylocalor cossyra TaxID=3108543 RepID=A0ABP1CAY4_9GAMM
MNFDTSNLQTMADALLAQLSTAGLKILGALVLFFVGRWLIRLADRMLKATFLHQKLDHTLVSYLASSLNVLLNIVLIVALLGYFGIETTSFAALLATLGIAIGAAWSGLLANFAAGVFLVLLRPFKVGDFVTTGAVTGTVKEIGLFSTLIITPDNVLTTVNNNRIFSDNIQNFSATPYRRVERAAQLAPGVDPQAAIQRLKTGLGTIPNVVGDPAPEVEILDFGPGGTVLAVRPYCHNDHYWQVFFDTNALIAREFGPT